jgi:hypothetical protein
MSAAKGLRNGAVLSQCTRQHRFAEIAYLQPVHVSGCIAQKVPIGSSTGTGKGDIVRKGVSADRRDSSVPASQPSADAAS